MSFEKSTDSLKWISKNSSGRESQKNHFDTHETHVHPLQPPKAIDVPDDATKKTVNPKKIEVVAKNGGDFLDPLSAIAAAAANDDEDQERGDKEDIIDSGNNRDSSRFVED